jgi:hypothetical protein
VSTLAIESSALGQSDASGNFLLDLSLPDRTELIKVVLAQSRHVEHVLHAVLQNLRGQRTLVEDLETATKFRSEELLARVLDFLPRLAICSAELGVLVDCLRETLDQSCCPSFRRAP